MYSRSTTGILLAFVVMLLLPLRLQAAACSATRIDLRGPWGQTSFNVELAQTPRERAIGLMNREQMDTGSGMLFIYPGPQPVAFWMKNTLIPLDMLFIDMAGRIVTIHENARPLDETPIPGGDNILAVLEINGGLSREIGLTVGSSVRHPAFDRSKALWPCE